jgi:alpha-beta hydrolase superfamily lysophospholipase
VSANQLITLTTPDRYLLPAVWSTKPTASANIIFIHGLGGTLFSLQPLLSQLVPANYNLLTFNNRGHDVVCRLPKIDLRRHRGTKSILAGAAHEVFTDCVHDLTAAVNFVASENKLPVILLGHSTGCQKISYFLAAKRSAKVNHIILLSPLSDYAGIETSGLKDLYLPALNYARQQLVGEQSHRLLPPEFWPVTIDAQRFLSLYTPDSPEEIFSYCQPDKQPVIYQKNIYPTLVVFGDKDENLDRPLNQVITWFKQHSRSPNLTIKTISGGYHNFWGQENQVAKIIIDWIGKKF